MPKYILLLIILLQLNICLGKEDSDRILIDPNSQKENIIKEGTEFSVKTPCSTRDLYLLNEKENKDTIKPKGSRKIWEEGSRCFIIYNFEAKAATKESISINFGSYLSKLQQQLLNKKPTPELIVEVDIAK